MNKYAVRQILKEEFRLRSDEIANLYIRVFADAPWYERYKVRMEGRWIRMGTPEEVQLLEKRRANGILKEEDIRPYYTVMGVKKNMKSASEAGGFSAAIAINQTNDQVIGASWGMLSKQVPVNEKRANIKRVIQANNLAPEKTFYFDETFVDASYRGMKIGGSLIRVRGNLAREAGCTYAIGRTINPIQINNFKNIFGSENVVEAYRNPKDIQADRKYYLICLKRE